MSDRSEKWAFNLVVKGKRRCLATLLSKHPALKTSNEAMLIFAAIWHNRSMLKWLLERGVSPDCRLGEGDNTPLMQAAADGDLLTMRLLLDFGADPNSTNSLGETPLGFAVIWEQPEAVRMLANAGAVLDTTSDLGDGRTLLDLATRSGLSAVAGVLREAGARQSDEI